MPYPPQGQRSPLISHDHSSVSTGGNTLLAPILKANADGASAILADNGGTNRGSLRANTSSYYGIGNSAGSEFTLPIGSNVAQISGQGASNRWWVTLMALG